MVGCACKELKQLGFAPMALQLLGMSLRARRDTTQFRVSLRARRDTTQFRVSLQATCDNSISGVTAGQVRHNSGITSIYNNHRPTHQNLVGVGQHRQLRLHGNPTFARIPYIEHREAKRPASYFGNEPSLTHLFASRGLHLKKKNVTNYILCE